MFVIIVLLWPVHKDVRVQTGALIMTEKKMAIQLLEHIPFDCIEYACHFNLEYLEGFLSAFSCLRPYFSLYFLSQCPLESDDFCKF